MGGDDLEWSVNPSSSKGSMNEGILVKISEADGEQ